MYDLVKRILESFPIGFRQSLAGDPAVPLLS